MAWNDLTLSDKARMIQLAVNSGITDLRTIQEVYNKYAEGGPVYTSTAELPAVIVTPDKDYSAFLNSLPDNQRFTPEEDYSTRRYWELHGKPKDFEVAKKLGMYTWDSSDSSYHANSIAWGDDNIGYFMKPKHHDTVKYEIDWYNKGLITGEGGKQHRARGKDRREWKDFKKRYTLDMSGDFYKYVPKSNIFDTGGPIEEDDPNFIGPKMQEVSLPKENIDYFKQFKSYDDWTTRARKEDVENPQAVAQAKYYYLHDPVYEEYFKFQNGPYKRYTDLRNKYERDDKYMIPLSGDTYRLRSLDANGNPTNKHLLKVDTGLLEYIYREAVRGGVDPKVAIALAVNESNLGTSKVRAGRAKEGTIGAFDLFSYWHGTDSVIYPNVKTVDAYSALIDKVNSGEKLTEEDLNTLKDLNKRYNHMADHIHEYTGDNVVADATKYFLAGKYPGTAASKERIDAYNKLVMSRFDELMNDKRFKTWWDSKNKKKK